MPSTSLRTPFLSNCLTILCFAAALLLPAASVAQTAAGGFGHTLIVKSDGTVWSTGLNAAGQLGDDTTTDRRVPAQVPGVSGVATVAAGMYHSLALTTGGEVLAWGSNQFGQLGNDSTTDRHTPVTLSLSGVTAIAAGEYYSMALLSNGDVYAWGRNNNGQLGTGNTTDSHVPVQVASGVAAIGAGPNHALLAKSDGTAWATGLNTYGQLGIGTTTSTTSFTQVSGITTATQVGGGWQSSIFLLADGTVKGAGYNFNGQIGDDTWTQRTSPVAAVNLTGIVAISFGHLHALALHSNGTLWAWGDNTWSQLGDNTHTDRKAPAPVAGLASIAGFAAAFKHSIAVDDLGVVYTWGDDMYGQLGDGTNAERRVPGAISDTGFNFKVGTPTFSIAAGTYTSNQTVVITESTPDATIHYTQTGVDPTESDPTIASGSSVTVDHSQVLKAKAWKGSMPASNSASATYTLQVATPTFTPNGGTFYSAQSVSIDDATPSVTLRYTTDGVTTPTESSPVYTSAVSLASTTTVKAVGFRSGWTPSNVNSTTFTMDFGPLSAPTANPAGGAFTGSVSVALSSIAGAFFRCTTNGTAVTTSSPTCNNPVVLSTSVTLRVKAYHADYSASPESSWTLR